jgi:hypothetical protein
LLVAQLELLSGVCFQNGFSGDGSYETKEVVSCDPSNLFKGLTFFFLLLHEASESETGEWNPIGSI